MTAACPAKTLACQDRSRDFESYQQKVKEMHATCPKAATAREQVIKKSNLQKERHKDATEL